MASGAQIGEAFVRIRPDASKFGTELNTEVTKAGKTAGDNLRTAFVAGGFALAARATINAASSLQQAVGGTTAVFGEASGAVTEFAEQAAESAGLSERAAREATSRIGGLLKGFGFTREEAAETSVVLAQLGADLAATFGGRPEDAVNALGAALRGEFDPLEQFGVSLNITQANLKAVELGLASSTSNVDLNARAQASLAIILERSADAQGQFAREADTAAGQTERAKAKLEDTAASIGSNVLPAVAKLAEGVGFVAEKFGDLPGAVQVGAIALGGVLLIAPKVITSFGAIATASTALRGSLDTLAIRALYAKDSLTSLSAVKTAGAVGGIVLFAEALNQLSTALTDYGEGSADRYLTSLQNASEDGFGGALASDIGGLRDAIDQLERADRNSTFGNFLGNFATRGSTDEARQQIQALDEALTRLAESNPDQAASAYQRLLGDLNISADEGARLFNDYAGAVEDAGLANTDATPPTQDATTAIKDQAEASKAATDRINELFTATERLFGAQLDGEQAAIDLRKAYDNLFFTTLDGTTTADQRREAELRVLQAMLDSADAAGDAAEQQAILEGRQITAGATAIAQRDKLIELANALAPDSPLRAQIAGYIAQLDVVIARQREAIPNLQGGGFLLPGQTGQATNLGAFAGRPMATGGAVTAGTYYPGGELGPELFRGNDGSVGFIPGQDGTVIPTSQISGGGTTVNQTFNIVAADTGKGIDEGIARARMAALTGLAA